MITYQLVLGATETNPSAVNKFVDGNQVSSIPFDPDNTDYQAFLKYQAEGGVVLPADEVTA